MAKKVILVREVDGNAVREVINSLKEAQEKMLSELILIGRAPSDVRVLSRTCESLSGKGINGKSFGFEPFAAWSHISASCTWTIREI